MKLFSSTRTRGVALGMSAALLAAPLVVVAPAHAAAGHAAPLVQTAQTAYVASSIQVSSVKRVVSRSTSPQRAAYSKAVKARKALDKSIALATSMSTGSKSKYLSKSDRKVVAKALSAAKKSRAKAVKYVSKSSVTRSKKATSSLTKARATLLKKTSKQRSLVSARTAAQKQFSKALTATSKALAAEKKLSSGKYAKKITSTERAELTSLRSKLVKAKSAALKKRKATSATSTKAGAKSLSSAASKLQKKVDAVSKRVTPKKPAKTVEYWRAVSCGGIDGLYYLPQKGWGREAVIADAKDRKCALLREFYTDESSKLLSLK